MLPRRSQPDRTKMELAAESFARDRATTRAEERTRMCVVRARIAHAITLLLVRPRRAVARALLVLVALSLLATESAAQQGAPKVRVRGAGRISARASRDTGHGTSELALSGALSDDAGQPLPGETVVV